jgi:hypothetical protein
VEEQVCDAISVVVNKHRCVGLELSEAHVADVCGEVLVPGPGRLLEPIQGLLQDTNIVRVGGVDKAGWLLVVDNLLEVAVEEGILHV